MVNKVIIIIISFFYSFIAYGQYLTISDINTTNKSESEICEEINTKSDSVLAKYPLDSTSIINWGYTFPSISLTKQEKRKGCLILIDTKKIVPDSVAYCDVYVRTWINPYCKVQCLEILNISPNIRTNYELLRYFLTNYIEGKIVEPGYLSENKKTAAYFLITLKIKIVNK